MSTDRTIKALMADVYPNIGKVLADYLKKASINRSKLSKQLSVPGASINRYIEKDTLQFKTLWNISVALNHNFIAEMGEKLPVEFTTQRETKLNEQIESLQNELEKTKFELSIYKNIVGK
jgi:hypothetical protein